MSAETPVPPAAPPARRPRPVLIFGAIIVALNALATAGDAANVVPPTVYRYVVLASIVAAAVGAFIVQGSVTPLADPRTAGGAPLVSVNALTPALRSAARTGALDAANMVRQAALEAAAAAGDPVDEHAATAPVDDRVDADDVVKYVRKLQE